MEHLDAIGTIILENGRTILLPCQLVNEDNQLWLHFLDQTHVLMFGWDRVEVVWTRILSKNRVDLGLDQIQPIIRVYTGKLNCKSLVRFLETDWLASNNSKSIYYDTSESCEPQDSTDEPCDMDDRDESCEPQDGCEPMDTSSEESGEETDSEELDSEEPAPKRGWFSWIW